jgi:hypothetical protein
MRAILSLTFLLLVACGDSQAPAPEPVDDAGTQPEGEPDPGRVTLHRLNRAEYNNTVRDLLHTSQRPADDFPADDHGYGFDNNADVLSLSPFQVELYARAAEDLVTEALAPARTEPVEMRYEAEALGATTGATWRDSGWQFRAGGALAAEVPFAATGRYVFTVRAGAGQTGAPLTMALRVGGLTTRVWTVEAAPDALGTYTTTLGIEAGTQTVEIVALEIPQAPADQTLAVDWFSVTGPAVAYSVVAQTTGAELDHGAEFGVADRQEGTYVFLSAGTLSAPFETHTQGQYRLSILAAGDQGGDEPAQLRTLMDGDELVTFAVQGPRDRPEYFATVVELSPGPHTLGLAFANDFFDPDNGVDRNLVVGDILLEGPLHVAPSNPVRDEILTCAAPAESPLCAEEILARFLRRAWRRPARSQELLRYRELVAVVLAQGGPFDQGIALALRAALTSPHFLFRVEDDAQGAEPRALTDHELATRLSYFLWSSMPDEELLAAADAGTLQDDEVLGAQTARMLADPKSRAFTDNFAGQWLQTRALFDVVPDYNVFPAYDEALQYGLYEETAAFFESFLHADLPVTEMFTADFSFPNSRVAAHYGVEGVDGVEPQRVEYGASTHRRGILTHGSVLTVTAYPTRTSPVKRGKWVLSQLLCAEPPPPPPGVEGLVEEVDPTGTLREQLEQHRADPSCASCHALMDPIGFAMEAYDGIGLYRTEDRGFPLDTSGELITGETFDNVHQLADILAEDERVTRCVTRHMTTYALGRGLEFDDKPLSEAIHAGFVADGARLSRLVHHIVQSRLFRWRRGEEAGE